MQSKRAAQANTNACLSYNIKVLPEDDSSDDDNTDTAAVTIIPFSLFVFKTTTQDKPQTLERTILS